jgi:predicted transglutaminase-like cysteine proteinase
VTYSADGDDDRWANAESTIRNGFGDCEDIAIAKRALLEMAGVSPDSMFLVLVRDVSRATDHAVLAVSRSGEMAILDSRTDRILPSQAIADYQPVLSYAETFAWTYGYREISPGPTVPSSASGRHGN